MLLTGYSYPKKPFKWEIKTILSTNRSVFAKDLSHKLRKKQRGNIYLQEIMKKKFFNALKLV